MINNPTFFLIRPCTVLMAAVNISMLLAQTFYHVLYIWKFKVDLLQVRHAQDTLEKAEAMQKCFFKFPVDISEQSAIVMPFSTNLKFLQKVTKEQHGMAYIITSLCLDSA